MEADDFIACGGNANGFRDAKMSAFGAYRERAHDFWPVAIQAVNRQMIFRKEKGKWLEFTRRVGSRVATCSFRPGVAREDALLPPKLSLIFGGPHSFAHQDAVAEPLSARVAAVLPRPSAALLGATFFIRVFVGIYQNQQADIVACFHRRCPHRGSLHQDVGNHAVVWIHTESAPDPWKGSCCQGAVCIAHHTSPYGESNVITYPAGSLSSAVNLSQHRCGGHALRLLRFCFTDQRLLEERMRNVTVYQDCPRTAALAVPENCLVQMDADWIDQCQIVYSSACRAGD